MKNGEFDQNSASSLLELKKSRRNGRPKVQLDWSVDDIEMLIKAVKCRPVLWDRSRPDYKMPHTSVWQEIANEFFGKYDMDECKAKWTNLRVSFNTNRVKYRKTNKRKKITWRFFYSLLFLDDSLVKQTKESTPPPSPVTDQLKLDDCEDSASASRPTTETPKSRCTKRKKSQAPENCVKEKAAVQALNVISNRGDNDEFSAFGQFVIAELRSIPREQASYVKRRLTRYLMDLMDEVAMQIDA